MVFSWNRHACMGKDAEMVLSGNCTSANDMSEFTTGSDSFTVKRPTNCNNKLQTGGKPFPYVPPTQPAVPCTGVTQEDGNGWRAAFIVMMFIAMAMGCAVLILARKVVRFTRQRATSQSTWNDENREEF